MTHIIWLPLTLLAGLFQAWRTAVQQRVRAELSVNAAGLVRYLYGLPVGIIICVLYVLGTGSDLPAISITIAIFAAAAGFAQILGTNLLLMAFGYRNYVVGTAYAKTEAVQGAILAYLMLGEALSPLTWLGIFIGVAGVMVVSSGGRKLRLADLAQPAALCGLGAGFAFTMTSIFVKAAAIRMPTDDTLLAGVIILVIVLSFQTLMQGGYVIWREREQVPIIFRSWRVSGQVGLLAALGSACWFSAFASAPVALVRAVGQVEVPFTLGFGRFYLKEALKRNEVIGILLVGAGVTIALIGAIG